MLWEDFDFRPAPVLSRDAAEALNRLWLEVRRLGQISVTAGLGLDSNEGGVVLSVEPTALNLPPGASNCCPCPVYQFTLAGLSPGCGGNGAYSLPFSGTPDNCVWSGNGSDGSSATLVMVGGAGALSVTTIGGCQAIYTLAAGSCGEFNASLAFASGPYGWPFSIPISCGFTTPPGENCCQCQVYQVVVSGSPGIGGGTYFLTFQTPCVWTQTLFAGSVGLVIPAGGNTATLTLAVDGGITIFTGSVGDCNSFVLMAGDGQTATVTCSQTGPPTPPGGGGGFTPPGSCWTCSPYNLPPTTDVRCEAVASGAGGIPGHSSITVYNRNVRIGWVACCPVVLSIGPWFFSHTAGCCDCNNLPGPLCCQCSEYNLTISGVSAGCDANDTYALFFVGPGCVWQGQGATLGGLAVLTMSDSVGGTAQLVITTGSCQAVYTGAVGNCNSFTLSVLGTPVGTGWPATVTLSCAPIVIPGPGSGVSGGTGPCVPATCQWCDGTQCNGVNNAPYAWTVKIPAGRFGGICGLLNGTNWTLSYFDSCTWEQSQIIGAFGVVMTLRINGNKDSTLTILVFDLANNTTIAKVVYHANQPASGDCCTTFEFVLTSDADCDCPPIPDGGGGSGGGCMNCPDPPGTPASVFFDGSAAGGFTGQFAPLNQKFTMVPTGDPCTFGSPVQFDPVSGGYAQAFMTFGTETFDVEDPGEPQGSDYALFLAVTTSSGGVICWLQYYSPEGGAAGQPDDCCHIPILDLNEQGSPPCTGTFPNAVVPIANCGGSGGGDGGGQGANCATVVSAIPLCCCAGGSGDIMSQCCPDNDLPRTLHGSFTGATGNCGCLPATFTLLWNPAHTQWEIDPTSLPPGFPPATGPCSGAPFNAQFRCMTTSPGTCMEMQFTITEWGLVTSSPSSCDCATQTWTFTGISFSGPCTGTANLTLTS